jgi:class 3 adenylate cyclase
VTFLFTDIQGSTRLWQQHPRRMRQALACHDAILRKSIAAHGGWVFKTVGDAFCAAFRTAMEGLEAAAHAQRALHTQVWDLPEPILVRMALHTGEAEERDQDYFGNAVNRAARIQSVGHGGQTLLSLVVAELVRDTLPEGMTLHGLGARRT